MANLLPGRRRPEYAPATDLPPSAHQWRWRRLLVFSVVFLAGSASGLLYTFMRPAEYRTAARLEILPSSPLPPAEGNAGAQPGVAAEDAPFLTQVQVLTSRPLLLEVADRLRKSGELPTALGTDAVERLQHMLGAEIVTGTNVVRLTAEGRPAALLPRLVNTLIAVFRDRLEAGYRRTAGTGNEQLSDEIRVLERKVAAKRREIDAFRSRYNIVSPERDENQLLSSARGLGQALSAAKSKLADAEGQLGAMREAVAAGKSAIGARDDPTVANLEQRASALREQFADLQLKFTPQYLDKDPNIKLLRGRLANLDQQIKTTRAAAQRLALTAAEEQAKAARAAVDRLQQQVNDNKGVVEAFTARFEDFKSMAADLANLEKLHRAALDRLAKLEARQREGAPRVDVLEAASLPQLPWRPNYPRDAAISVIGAMLLGFFAVWLVEFLFRPAPFSEPAAPRSWWPAPFALEGGARPRPLMAAELVRLPGSEAPHRELSDAEIGALLGAAQDDGRLILGLLLIGLTADEIAALRWEQVDRDAGTIRIAGESARDLRLVDPLRRFVDDRAKAQSTPSAPLLSVTGGVPLSADDIARQVLYAAYDAGLDDADAVTPRLVRHTYLVYLLRQGLRLADLARLVGRIPQDELAATLRAVPSQARVPLERVETMLPALRGLSASDDDIGGQP